MMLYSVFDYVVVVGLVCLLGLLGAVLWQSRKPSPFAETSRRKSDEEVAARAKNLTQYTEEGQRSLLVELDRRGIPHPLMPASEPVVLPEMPWQNGAEGEAAQLVTIATCSQPIEAEILKGKLETAGIWARIADGETVAMNWLYSTAVGGVKLQVRDVEADQARALLQEPDLDEDQATSAVRDDDAPECPECGSAHTVYEKYSKQIAFISMMIWFPIPFPKRQWVCRDCGHSWRQPHLAR